MEKVKSRLRAKAVAVIDIVIAVNYLIFLGIVFDINIIVGKTVNTVVGWFNYLSGNYVNGPTLLFVMIGLVILMAAVLDIIQLVIACILLNATDSGAIPGTSYEDARVYCNMTLIFFIISVLFYFVRWITNGWPDGLFHSNTIVIPLLVVKLIYRGITLHIVGNFVYDLKPLQDPKVELSDIAVHTSCQRINSETG